VLSNGDLVSSGSDKTILTWNTTTFELKLNITTDHKSEIFCLAALPGGDFTSGDLASGSFDKTIKIWDTKLGVLLRTLTGHSHQIRSLAVLNSTRLASASYDQSIRLWNPNTGAFIASFVGHKNSVLALAVLKNGGYLVSSDASGSIKIWNDTGFAINTIWMSQVSIPYLTVLDNGRLANVYTKYPMNAIQIWDAMNSTMALNISNAHSGNINTLAKLNNGDLVSASWDKSINVWSPYTGALKQTLLGHTQSISTLAVLKSGYLASAGGDLSIRIWRI
jgi:WD40 repeat protein